MKQQEFNAILQKLQSRQSLDCNEMQQAITWILGGEADEAEVKQFLELLADKGETVSELVGAARALRQTMQPVDSERQVIVDTCGTGGDGSKTFNISTAAALVAAAAGVAVAKHGNRKVTSSTGSADVLAELGINLEASPAVVQECLKQLGICFCFAPFFHPAMKHVGKIRREINRPTIFNRLGPLANPALAGYQVLGVGKKNLLEPMAEALQQLETTRSIVVCGDDGVDEVSLSTSSSVLEVTPEAIQTHVWHPADFGIQPAARDELFADDPAASAACIRQVLDGRSGPKRDVVVINAAAALWITGRHASLKDCASDIQAAIDSGRAKELVASLATMSNSNS
jgi:anthranilate phosphoribosyltransferase